MTSRPSRRDALRWVAASAVLLAVPDALRLPADALGVPTGNALAGPDANGWRLLPGFSSRIVATTGINVPGSTYPWHAAPDGGATLVKPNGGWYYVSNSEHVSGGAGVIEFGPDGAIVGGRSVLTDTIANCSGCMTPWGTYLSCEEHPYGGVWEVDPTGARPAVRRGAMGSFQHEGGAIDPDRRVVYLTEDRPDGGLYRFSPSTWGDLSNGALEVLVETAGALTWAPIDPNGVPTLPHQQHTNTRRFSGGEGIVYWRGSVVFTTKGDNKVWALDPNIMRLSVLYDAAAVASPVYTGVDQIVIAPWGDLMCAEDGGDMQVIVLGADGSINVFAQLTGVPGSEITGLAFDPSGTRLYVTSQRNPGRTYEISGPFPTLSPPPPAGGPATTRFEPLPPVRILDTREGLGAAARPVPPDTSIALQVSGRGGVPAEATAVVMNLTATAATGLGFVTVWPFGRARPVASNLNVERPGQTIPNLVTVPLGPGGAVSIYTQGGAHLVADVAGYYLSNPGPTTAGRLRPLVPARLLDTRSNGGSPVPDSGVIEVQVRGQGEVPGSGVAAAVLNVTATDPTGPGFVTCWPAGTARPLASNLNIERAGQTIANQVVVPVGADGRVSLFAQRSTHLVVDIAAWITDTSRSLSTLGRFVVVDPARLLDTRIGVGSPAGLLPEGARITLAVAGRGGLPTSGVLAAVLNVTLTEAVAPGFVTVWPSGQARPVASSVNAAVAGQTIPNHVLVALSPDGTVDLFTQSGGHLIADVLGWVTA